MCFTVLFLAAIAFAASPAKADSSALSETLVAAQDTVVDTIYVIQESGIPWNRENFDPERLVRHDTFDPALKVAYTYSVSFIGGSFGSFAQQSFMAHFAYEFTPALHLYANVGLWMPLYSSLRFGKGIAREDVKQGNVDVLIPDISLEYKPNDKMTFCSVNPSLQKASQSLDDIDAVACRYSVLWLRRRKASASRSQSS